MIISNINENSFQMQMGINILDQFHSNLYRKQLFCNQKKFQKNCENLMFKTILTKENLHS